MVLIAVMIIVVKVSVHAEHVVTAEFLIVSDVEVLTLVLKTPLSFTAFWFPPHLVTLSLASLQPLFTS